MLKFLISIFAIIRFSSSAVIAEAHSQYIDYTVCNKLLSAFAVSQKRNQRETYISFMTGTALLTMSRKGLECSPI